MPLVAYNELPTFERLRDEGQDVLSCKRAEHQDIRELHIGLLNMMPDAALQATERQFYRLVGRSNQIAQFYMHPFTLEELPRSSKAKQHIKTYYKSFESIKANNLDGLIITGANVTHPNLDQEAFWKPLAAVVDWAWDNVTSTLCSCLATHAVLQMKYGQTRQHLGYKRWGVYRHRVVNPKHPLVAHIDSCLDVPHSRFNEISAQQLQDAGLNVLIESDTAGVHMAVSADQFRQIFLQGHPEYDSNSLLKEYKREVLLYFSGQRESYPPFPEHYFSAQAKAILDEYRLRCQSAIDKGQELIEFPEKLLTPLLDITWRDSANSVVSGWLGMIYQLTHVERAKQFMDGVNPQDPLGIHNDMGT